MLSYELRIEAKNLLNAFESASAFFKLLHSITCPFPKIEEQLYQIAEGGDKTQNAVNQLRTIFSQVRNQTSSINIRDFFSSLELLQNRLLAAKESSLDDLQIIDGISVSIDEFSELYEKFLSTYTPQAGAQLIIGSRQLLSMLNGFKTALLFFLHNLEQHHYDLEHQQELSILLPSAMSITQFAHKLLAIEDMYLELCALLDVSSVEHPMVVQKIESGSLWAKVIGHSVVIKLMSSFLESGAQYIYRNFTKEGRLLAIPQKVDAIDSVLKLTQRLEKEGINTKEAKEHIAKAAVAISKDLNALLDGQPEITINQIKHSIGKEIQEQLMDLKQPLRLELKDDSHDSN